MSFESRQFVACTSLLVVACLFSATPGIAQNHNVVFVPESIQPAGPLCGLFALAGAIKAVKGEVDFERLLDGDFVSSREGSTISDLCSAAENAGLTALPLKRMTASSLKNATSPVLLHLNRSRHQTTSRHWVLFLGDDNGKARILDPPFEVQNVRYSDVMAEWDGLGILISEQSSPYTFFGSLIHHLSPLFAGLVILAMLALFPSTNVGTTNVPVPFQVVMIAIFAGMAANLVHWLSPNGFHRNPSSVALVLNAHAASRLPEIKLDDMRKIVDRFQNDSGLPYLLVDARQTDAFLSGHIPGAINVPVDSPPAMLSRVIESMSGTKTVVVYCQSRGCDWNERVAGHFVFAGFHEVCLYNGGWQEWAANDGER